MKVIANESIQIVSLSLHITVLCVLCVFSVSLVILVSKGIVVLLLALSCRHHLLLLHHVVLLFLSPLLLQVSLSLSSSMVVLTAHGVPSSPLIGALLLHLRVHELLLHLPFGHLPRHHVIVCLVLPRLVLPSLSFLEHLHVHPLLVRVCVEFFAELAFDLLPLVQLSQVRRLLRLLQLLLHQPLVHGLHA